jgi:hypothetical protein
MSCIYCKNSSLAGTRHPNLGAVGVSPRPPGGGLTPLARERVLNWGRRSTAATNSGRLGQPRRHQGTAVSPQSAGRESNMGQPTYMIVAAGVYLPRVSEAAPDARRVLARLRLPGRPSRSQNPAPAPLTPPAWRTYRPTGGGPSRCWPRAARRCSSRRAAVKSAAPNGGLKSALGVDLPATTSWAACSRR